MQGPLSGQPFGVKGFGGVLVVDDSPTIIAVMTDTLAQLGIPEATIRTATSEADAVALVASARPHLAFVDMDIGEGRGENVMRAILTADPRAKVILMTGLGREEPRVVQAVSHGAFGFLRKPLRREAVKQLLDEVEAEDHRYDRIR